MLKYVLRAMIYWVTSRRGVTPLDRSAQRKPEPPAPVDLNRPAGAGGAVSKIRLPMLTIANCAYVEQCPFMCVEYVGVNLKDGCRFYRCVTCMRLLGNRGPTRRLWADAEMQRRSDA